MLLQTSSSSMVIVWTGRPVHSNHHVCYPSVYGESELHVLLAASGTQKLLLGCLATLALLLFSSHLCSALRNAECNLLFMLIYREQLEVLQTIMAGPLMHRVCRVTCAVLQDWAFGCLLSLFLWRLQMSHTTHHKQDLLCKCLVHPTLEQHSTHETMH